MTEGLLRHYMQRSGRAEQVAVHSAGTVATPNKPAISFAVDAMSQRGIDIGGHRTRQMTPDLLDRADLILVMDEEHRRNIFYLGPTYLTRTFLLSELSGVHDYIYDPFGLDMNAYVATRDLIETYIRSGWRVLMKRLELSQGDRDVPLPST